MPRLGSVIGCERPLVNTQHRQLEPRPSSITALVCTPMIPSGPQRRWTVRGKPRRATKARIRLIDGLVDALVTQAHRRVVGEPGSQVAADLLRAPPLSKEFNNQLAERQIRLGSPPVVTCSTPSRVPMRIEGPIDATCERVAPQLARDRRRRTVKYRRNLPDTLARASQVRDFDALVLREKPWADLAHQQTVKRRHKPDHQTVPIGLTTAGPAVARAARHPNLAGRSPDTPPPLTQLHELLTFGRLRTTPRPLLHTTR